MRNDCAINELGNSTALLNIKHAKSLQTLLN